MMLRILIGTPVLGGVVTTQYMLSVLDVIATLMPRARFQIMPLRGTNLPVQRDVIANTVLRDERFSHLLFVDADMGFKAALVAKMLDIDQPVVGALMPRRFEPPPEGAEPYVGRPTSPRVRRGDFLKMVAVGTGILLIQRAALVRMTEAAPDLWTSEQQALFVTAHKMKGRVFQFFCPVRGSDGAYSTDDESFCFNWTRRAGGELWACATETIEHIGPHVYTGSYADALTGGA